MPDVEPIWCSLFAKALEGKDVKDLLLNVGSGGGAAAAPAAGGGAAAAGGEAAAEAPKEEEEEGKLILMSTVSRGSLGGIVLTWLCYRERGVRRGYGLRSFRLSDHRQQTCSRQKGGEDGLKRVEFRDGLSSSCGSCPSILAATAAVIRPKNVPISSSSIILPVKANRRASLPE